MSDAAKSENETEQSAESYLGAVVRDKGNRYQVVDIESPVDHPMLADNPTIVGETPDGHQMRWGLSIFEELEIVTDDLDAPDRPEPVVPISVQEGLLTESKHVQKNAVVECRECGELVREPDATPHMGDPTDAHDHSAWTCDSCSSFSDEEADVLDIDEDDLESCPYARWSDRLQAWTIGSDSRIDDGLWQPDEVEPATVETPTESETCDQTTPTEAESSGQVAMTDGGVDADEEIEIRCDGCGKVASDPVEHTDDEGNVMVTYCVACESKRYRLGLKPAEHPQYKLQEVA